MINYFCRMQFPHTCIKFNETESSNDTAKALLKSGDLPHLGIVFTEYQTKGRGQRTNHWHSEKGQNLLFSIAYLPKNMQAKKQFYISKAISLGITDYLNSKQEGFCIKWPNDIFFKTKKICGILIENTISGANIKTSIIGIGLNLNQKEFPPFLPDAVSLSNITGKTYDKEKELSLLSDCIFKQIATLEANKDAEIDEKYKNSLLLINELCKFKDKKGIFTGYITDTLPDGRLIIKTSQNETRYYNFKEVEFLFKN